MLLLLDFQHRPVFESPLHDVGFGGCAFDGLAGGELGPEGLEVGELDEVPDGGEGGGDHGGFGDGG